MANATVMAASHYIGRFAPSPTGPLHFGSLVAALGSYLQARSQDGVWYVRIEDIDPPREVVGASDSIIRTLDGLGFEWDGEVSYQCQNTRRFLATVDSLCADGHVYACACSRKQIAQNSPVDDANGVYPGTCRPLQLTTNGNALRVKVHGSIEFNDALQGSQRESLPKRVGDFVIKRRDGLIAYQLAVVVDDAAQGVTEVVRGADLLDNTCRQVFLQQLLGLQTPRYCHLPVAVGPDGKKLSKQSFAAPIEASDPLDALQLAWSFLGQTRCDGEIATIEEFWHWATTNWSLDLVPKVMARAAPVLAANNS